MGRIVIDMWMYYRGYYCECLFLENIVRFSCYGVFLGDSCFFWECLIVSRVGVLEFV